MKRWLMMCVAVMSLTACRTDQCNTPFGEGGVVDIVRSDFSMLGTVGGTADVNRGHRGIIVRCEAIGQYAAFEMACPNDHDVRMVPDDKDYAVRLTCPTCGSSFDIIYGNPLEGATASCPLYRYTTEFDGRYIYIR